MIERIIDISCKECAGKTNTRVIITWLSKGSEYEDDELDKAMFTLTCPTCGEELRE